MDIQFYGVRGSIATSGPDTVMVGGNTSCVAVRCGDEQIVFDAGTGIRRLGDDLGPVDVNVHLFLSHLHWDHIQGFPFFTPAYVPGNDIQIYRPQCNDDDATLQDTLSAQMQPPTFPVGLDAMRANLGFNDIPLGERIRIGGAQVSTLAVDHPNGCSAYRVDYRGHSVVYATDLEHNDTLEHELAEFASGADLLIYDAMYTPEEYAGDVGMCRHGWGHSTFEAGARIAESAGANKFLLFHHDPSHDDKFMQELATRAQRRFSASVIAKEGDRYTL